MSVVWVYLALALACIIANVVGFHVSTEISVGFLILAMVHLEGERTRAFIARRDQEKIR